MVEEDKDDIPEDKFEAWTARMAGGQKRRSILEKHPGRPAQEERSIETEYLEKD
jgi:hypothetical protein